MKFNVPRNSTTRLTDFRLARERIIEAKFHPRRHRVFAMIQNTVWITVGFGAHYVCLRKKDKKKREHSRSRYYRF